MDFIKRRTELAERNWHDVECRAAASTWHDTSRKFDYQYMFEWAGRPIIQDPQDICALQEIIWTYQPNVIVETGIARGGSLVLSASILAALAYGEFLHGQSAKQRTVIGIDIDIRSHNRAAIECHPLGPMIELVEGSSTAADVVAQVSTKLHGKVMVILDSNHTRDHVLRELEIYAPMVSEDSALLVMDTGIEYAPPASFNVERPWGPGNSPMAAVADFLATEAGAQFEQDRSIEKRHLLTCAPGGLLIRKKA